MFMLAFSLNSCVGALLSEKIVVRLKKRTALVAGIMIACAIGCFAFHNIVLSVVALSLAGFCASVLYPFQSSVLNQMIPSEQRATLISINSMFFSIGMIILFPIAGFLADKFGLAKIFAVLGILLFIFVVGFGRKMKN